EMQPVDAAVPNHRSYSMENNAVEKAQQYREKPIPDAVISSVKQFGNKAAAAASEQIGKVADVTEKNVRKYPLAAIGIALGSGIALGTLGTILFTPRPPTMMDRVNDMKLGSQ